MYCLQWLLPLLLIPRPANPFLFNNHSMFMTLYLASFFSRKTSVYDMYYCLHRRSHLDMLQWTRELFVLHGVQWILAKPSSVPTTVKFDQILDTSDSMRLVIGTTTLNHTRKPVYDSCTFLVGSRRELLSSSSWIYDVCKIVF